MRAYFDDKSAFSASNHQIWDSHWDNSNIFAHYKFEKESSYDRKILSLLLKPGDLFLEAGCGPGGIVLYAEKDLGSKAFGIDIAKTTLVKAAGVLGRNDSFAVADTNSLPFPDGTFDVCYSGGVAEHFIQGPERTIRECLRILKPAGTLVIFVPFLNMARRAFDLFTMAFGPQPSYRLISSYCSGSDASRFHEYYFTRGEFKKILREFDVGIISMHGCSVINFMTGNTKLSSPSHPVSASGATGRKGLLRKHLKRLIVNEDARNPVEKVILRLSQELFGHMLVAIVRKKGTR